MDYLDIVARYVVPPILGGIAGLFSPWANWGIEKRRQQLARRRELVTGWRLELIPMLSDRGKDWSDVKPLMTASPYFASLEPHLSPKAREMIHAQRTIYVGEDVFLKLLTSEIGRIERKWKLV
ncbi:hypothetical protein FDV58_37710 [Bradyrhizobium elkanii]|uniref:Uncharacterized protein n=1 Tax=Bradyrhizobium elkanii TaxID=29448 RepID=A0A4U6RGK7_BRAEL|nr:hypothetical protein [Bradyrhizobium elkanii]TKV73294.1 hypothetical protein FDV58_37710 [Bradyrhizobium elkanii]